jgi:tetratricopeptide (TPR) repeat protein
MPAYPGPRPRRLLSVALSLSLLGACGMLPLQVDDKATAPVIDGFGASSLEPSQANEAARKLFAQGMAQVYAFNGAEAIRAFKAALAKDPSCGLCAWGVAYQMGPNINNPKRSDLKEALRYVDYAMRHRDGASPRDAALIESLALRYGHPSVARDIAPLTAEVCSSGGAQRADPLDVAYAERMRALATRFAGDPDVLSIYAEAEMIATTGDWWDSATGKPGGRIGELADQIEAQLARHPAHVGLNHYMIHVVDAVPVARRAEAAADRLGQLAPKSPHLLHMPAHTFVHLGRYADATRVNQLAVAADDAMDRELKRQHFAITKDWRSHNLHFQWYGTLMEGRTELALQTARTTAAHARGDHEYGEYQRSLPLLTLAYLQRWDALLNEPVPSGKRGLATVLDQMARGIALARTGRIDEARAAQARLEPAAEQLLKKFSGQDGVEKIIRSLVSTAQLQLRAEIALAARDSGEALAQQARAVDASVQADAKTEPPMLASAPRQRLGAMQMQAGRYTEAEQTYRADLAAHPGSGWALRGLGIALAAQGKEAEARAAGRDLERSWPLADSNLRAER